MTQKIPIAQFGDEPMPDDFEADDSPDDDEEAETPQAVIDLLGFDPAELDDDGDQAAAAGDRSGLR